MPEPTEAAILATFLFEMFVDGADGETRSVSGRDDLSQVDLRGRFDFLQIAGAIIASYAEFSNLIKTTEAKRTIGGYQVAKQTPDAIYLEDIDDTFPFHQK